ncbi:hypothetical protein [Fulvivirga sedimenti]|uniref:Uncharacterized protein n=1 Tax=Fulvivirga sedimenti TaxID=2879465 RepID=A0A9X1HLY3_9BACT|nr:hypothetical protein [Fulvivirga sedimenti]MCA6074400.1 hypothetical protein [Fulvivirga sedimenti]
MTLIPYKSETVVSTLPPQEVLLRLQLATMPAVERQKSKGAAFQGLIADDHFRISQSLSHPNNYVPLIEGQLDQTRHGTIIFLRYKLFFSSAMFLVFWTMITGAAGAFLLFTKQNYEYAALAFAMGLLNYVIVMMNFKKQVHISHNLLMEKLNID